MSETSASLLDRLHTRECGGLATPGQYLHSLDSGVGYAVTLQPADEDDLSAARFSGW